MRRAVLIWATACGIAGALQPAWAEPCADADPLRVTAQVYGDFEFTADPDDPAQHLIYLNHVDDGPSSIVVARMNGVTGKIEPGTLTTIADNFDGDQVVNGPEFVHPPGLGLGILYRALDGAHGVFRPNEKTPWNHFVLDVNGALATMNPPVLASSYRSSYETGGLPLGQNTYGLLDGPCLLRCFASVRSGVPTDVARVLQTTTHLTIPSIESLVQSPDDGTIDFEACIAHGAAKGLCGLFEAAIDGAGGFAPGSFKLVSSLPLRVGSKGESVPLAVERHPVTGTNVIFIGGSTQSGQTIDVYEEPAAGGVPVLIASVPAERSDHYRVIDSPTEIVLHYLVRHGDGAGSYSMPVTASKGKRLQVGAIKKIAAAADGAEVEYLPAAGKFAIFYRTSARPSVIERCFFDP